MKYSDIIQKLFEYNDPSKNPKLLAWLGNSWVKSVVFHGSPHEIKKVKPGTMWFTQNPALSSAYANGHIKSSSPTNYPVYIKLLNPLVVDAEGSNWDSIPFDLHLDDEEAQEIYDQGEEVFATTDEIAEYAKNNGYDGVIIESVVDGYDGESENDLSTVFCTFSPNQVKSVFAKEFKDSENISESPSQKFKVFHGSFKQYDSFDVNSTERGAFFTDDYESANRYGNVKEYEISFNNPYETDFDGNTWDEGDGDFNSLDDLVDYVREEGEYDGVIAYNIRGNHEDEPRTDFIVFNNNQIKTN